jgi:hypothetical protein
MPDSNDTRILKDINRHLAHIDETAVGEKEEFEDLNKNIVDVMSSFSSALNTEMQAAISASSSAIKNAFGNLEKTLDFDPQADALDNVVSELKSVNNKAEEAQKLEFLKEQEREQDLKINRRTNDLLEDLVDKEDESAALDKKETLESKSWMTGLLGGLAGGAGLKGLLKLGKTLFFPALLAVVGLEFLKGWNEAGEDASVLEKFKSGLSEMISGLTFGLISKEFMQGILDTVQDKIKAALDSFADIWNDEMSTFGEKLDQTISNMTLGLLSEADAKKLRLSTQKLLEKLNGGIQSLLMDSIGLDLNEAVQDFYASIEQLIDDTVLLFTDPVALLIKKMNDSKKNLAEDIKAEEERAKQGDISQLDEDDILEMYATGEMTDAQKKALEDRAKDRADDVDDIWRKTNDYLKDSKRRIDKHYEDEDRKARGLKNLEDRRSNVGQKGIEERVERERALTQKKRELESNGNAVQINNNSSVVGPTDTQTENDDRNLHRSSGIEGSW